MTTAAAERPAVNNGTALTKLGPMGQLGQRFSVQAADVDRLLRNTVIRPDKDGREATAAEVCAFAIVCNEYGLNPFTREIHGFISKGRLSCVVGIDGWVKLVNRYPDYDGVQFEHREGNDGKLLAITCRIFNKARSHPTEVTEYMAECYRDMDTWKTWPRRMLRHKAYIQCARIAFGLCGIYDEEEANDFASFGTAIKDVIEPTGRSAADLRERLSAPSAQNTEPEAPPAHDPGPGRTFQQVPDAGLAEGEVKNDPENAANALEIKISSATTAKTLYDLESEITQANENGQIHLLWHDKLQAFRVERLKGLGKASGKAGAK
jgi:phage recombination protein Bet